MRMLILVFTCLLLSGCAELVIGGIGGVVGYEVAKHCRHGSCRR